MTIACRRRARLTAAIAALGVFAAACSSSTAPDKSTALGPSPVGDRGRLTSASPVRSMTADQIRAHLRTDGFDVSAVRVGVHGYQLTYVTVDARGRATTASGLVALPDGAPSPFAPVEFLHGTLSGAGEAPSVDDGGRSDEALLFASAGYAAIAPDGLGLGRGVGPHPYLQLSTETSSGVDLLRAARTFVHRRHGTLADDVLVAGFSQGGPGALGVAKYLAANSAAPFRLRAVAGVSGPYALGAAELPAVLHGALDERDAAFYLAYLLTSWNQQYRLYGSPAEVFRSPYDRTVPALFDGRHDERQIFPHLPASPARLLTKAALTRLEHPTGALAAALRANDLACTGWRRAAPVRLYAATGDEQVTAGNTRVCQRELAAAGVHPVVVDLGRLAHFPSERAGLARALAWFAHSYPPESVAP